MSDTNILNISEEDRITLTVRNLVVSTPIKDVENSSFKKIIDGVDLDVCPGEVLAVLGGSGSGKTTLLNTLSQRVTSSKSFQFEGMLKYNDLVNINQIRSSYLLQDDVFLPFLTVRETLEFGADLKLPTHVTKREKAQLIDSILFQLGLDRIESTVISSSPGVVNLSGGERRLVSLAQQLLNKPSLLFLDEPTTGLDATSSIRLLTVIQNLAKKFGITVILTIHQPRYEILAKLDKISILLKGGKLVYFGAVQDSLPYFSSLGYTIGGNVNLADSLIDLSMKDYSSIDLEFESTKRVNLLIDNWTQHQTTILNLTTYEDTLRNLASSKPRQIPFMQQLSTLTRRTLVITMRDRFSLMMLNFGMIVISLIDGWLFYKPHHDTAGIRTLQSQLYVLLETIGFVPLYFELSRLWQLEGRFYFRERNEGIVTAMGWILSRHVAKFIAEIFPISLLFSLIVYFMWGLEVSLKQFFVFFAVVLLTNLTGMCCSMMCFALAQDFSTSALYTNVYYQLQNNGCGFFVNSKTMPVYVRWTKYITFFWYGYGALLSNQFTDWMGACVGTEEQCLEYSGTYILTTLGFPQHWIKLPLCILLCWALGFDLFAILFLNYKSTNVAMSKSKNSNFLSSDSDHKSEIDYSVLEKNDDHKRLLVDITLENIEVWVSAKKFDFGLITIVYQWCYRKLIKRSQNSVTKDYSGKKLLNNINAKFSAGKVNAVLGPSGSGKSTLLNYLAGRLPNTSNFADNGNIYLNSTKIPLGKSLGKLCSYVTQHDDHLIPTLTVKETLYFQGKIRLPKQVKDNLKLLNSYIEDLIAKMGLKDCENIPIGSAFIKGISGGEKKRVSILIQLLDDSKILLLDEPTSGLDSFSATQILNILNKLAEEDNKTIILTIHQPKLELFQQFGKILLLSRGGNTIYNDTTQNLNDYLTSLGYPCPNLKNIADHLLDLVSQNIDEDQQTAMERINSLMMNFQNNYKNNSYIDDLNFDQLSKLIVTKYKKSFTDSYSTLTRRQLLTMMRDKKVLFCRLLQIVATAGVQALYFAPLKDSYDGISNRLGVIQETMNMLYIGFLNNIVVYPWEVSYFTTEYSDGVVDIELFFLLYLTIELPFEIAGSLLFSALVGIATDLSRSLSMFFSMFYVSFLMSNCGESLGIMIVTMFSNLDTAINILANLLTIGIFMAGTMSLHMPVFFRAWNYISPLKYGVGAILKLGFTNQTFRCEIGDTCDLNTGEAVLEYYGLDCNFQVYMGVLAAIVVIYRVVAYLLLCIKIRMS